MIRAWIIVTAAAAAAVLLTATTGVHQNTLVGTVAQVAALSPATGVKALITDGASAGDCTIGGGSTQVWCYWNGSAWVVFGGSGGGAWSEVSEVTASGTTQNLTIGSHEALRLTFTGITVSSDDSRLSLRVDVGGVQSTSYRHEHGSESSSGSSESFDSQTGTEIPLTDDTAAWGIGNATGESLGCTVYVWSANSTTNYATFHIFCTLVAPSGSSVQTQGTSIWDGGTGALDGIQVLAGSSMTGGTITVEALN